MADSDQAERYRELAHIQQSHGLRLMEIAQLTPGKVVLDLGCGPGNITSLIAGKVAPRGRVVGVDPDAKRIEVAKRMYGDVTNLSFVVGSDSEFPGCGIETYDIIYSNLVFHWIKDKQKAFKNIYESLKPGGTLVLAAPVEFAQILQDLFKTLDEERCNRILQKMHYEPSSVFLELIREAGFTSVWHEETTHVAYFRGVEHLCEWVKASHHGEFDVKFANADRFNKVSFETDDTGSILGRHSVGFFVSVKPSLTNL